MGKTLFRVRRFIALFGAFALVLAAQGAALADGTETLGDPSIAISSGSGFAAGGVGMDDGQPASFDVTVPAGAAINQVLIYWEGFQAGPSGDDTITVDGNSVTGTLIGGPTNFFGSTYSSTYRADITGLGLVSAGTTTLTVSDMDFDRHNNGVGVLVVYDDGTAADLQLRDGNDLAFHAFDPTLDTTVAQTFSFASADADRDVDLTLFASSVTPDGDVRPNSVEVTVDGSTTVFDTPFQSNEGPQFDVEVLTVTVPAGVTELTVQVLSNDPPPTGDGLPASLVWIGAGLTVPIPEDGGGGEGCTPGYWKQDQHLDSWVGFSPGDSYDAVFGVSSSGDWTLLEAAAAKGGGEKALARHATAALLNSASAGVDYEFSTAEVITLVQNAYATGDFEGTKNALEFQNELGCLLN
jgi:hypothetical protein